MTRVFLFLATLAVLVGTASAQQPPENLEVLKTEHWTVFYTTSDQDAKEVGKALEMTREIFIDTFEKIGFEIKNSDRKFVCELYKDEQSFKDHRKRSAPSFGWYSTGNNKLTLIDPGDTEVAGLKLSLVWTATHEGAHQLCYNLGLLDKRGAYPPWLLEGLAGAFETDDATNNFGPHSGRVTQKIRIIQELVEKDEYAPLLKLATMRRSPSKGLQDRFTNVPKERIQIYAPGASLATYLILHRPEQLMVYMQALSARPASGSRTGQWRDEFNEAFRNIDALETDWERWILSLDGG